MGVFSRSWKVTKVTFNVMKKDKELFLFPILGGFFSLLFLLALLFPTIITYLMQGIDTETMGGLEYLLIFVTYLGLVFISTFFNVAVVYTAKKRFEGGDAKFKESIKFSFSKIHLIFMWSLLSATVGLILRVLENISERFGQVGRIFLLILRSILGIVWSLATIFVIPGMVYHNLGPIDAIKRSIKVLRKTWGESIIRYIGLGFAQFIFIILGIIGAIVLLILSSGLGIGGIVFVVLLIVFYFLGIFIVFSVANSVFNTALYHYAINGKIPFGYSREIISNAFRHKKKSSI